MTGQLVTIRSLYLDFSTWCALTFCLAPPEMKGCEILICFQNLKPVLQTEQTRIWSFYLEQQFVTLLKSGGCCVILTLVSSVSSLFTSFQLIFWPRTSLIFLQSECMGVLRTGHGCEGRAIGFYFGLLLSDGLEILVSVNLPAKMEIMLLIDFYEALRGLSFLIGCLLGKDKTAWDLVPKLDCTEHLEKLILI